jgi:hypothetical protein
MKKIILCLTTILLLFAFSTSCKEKQTLKDNNWEVESMKVHTDSALVYPPSSPFYNSIILSFPKAGEYRLRLDANTSWGKVSIVDNKINFHKKAYMTLVCCDSPFANNCNDLLRNNINRYTINGDNLVLKGNNGEIINFVKQ